MQRGLDPVLTHPRTILYMMKDCLTEIGRALAFLVVGVGSLTLLGNLIHP